VLDAHSYPGEQHDLTKSAGFGKQKAPGANTMSHPGWRYGVSEGVKTSVGLLCTGDIGEQRQLQKQRQQQASDALSAQNRPAQHTMYG